MMRTIICSERLSHPENNRKRLEGRQMCNENCGLGKQRFGPSHTLAGGIFSCSGGGGPTIILPSSALRQVSAAPFSHLELEIKLCQFMSSERFPPVPRVRLLPRWRAVDQHSGGGVRWRRRRRGGGVRRRGCASAPGLTASSRRRRRLRD